MIDRSEAETYWDVVEVPYQHGPHKHRLFMLDLLKEKGIKSLLDVGCGTGPIYELLINAQEDQWDNITKYKGIDYSKNFIQYAQELFGEQYFELGDARDIKEKDDSWDCVLLMHSLDHVKEYQQVIAEAVRVSKQYIVIMLWREFPLEGEVNTNEINEMEREPGTGSWPDTYLTQYTREKLWQEFKRHNLRVVEEVTGDILNSGQSKWNNLILLEKL